MATAMKRRLARLGAAPWLAGAALTAAAAAPDLPGSGDPPGFERFPGAWIVAWSAPGPVRGYDFITGPIDKIRRDVRIDNSVRMAGTLTRVTWRAPDGTRLEDAVAHYRELLLGRDARVVFECAGPDCGRSNVWANDVFGVPVLAAPRQSQHYVAASIDAGAGQPLLAAVYVVQRGNRRVYAHVDAFLPDPGVAVEFARNRDLAEMLARRGHVVVEGVVPARTGTLDAEALAGIDAVAPSLSAFSGQTLYVICHLGGSSPTAALLERSTTCAAQAAERLAGNGVTAEPFGAGPLMPRDDAPPERLELVSPHRLRRP